MAVADSKTGRGELSPPAAPRPKRLLRRLGWLVAVLLGGSALILAGFAWFIGRVPSAEVKLNRSADGIVALTGGASRVTDALELLATGHGKRLLISGLNRATTLVEIARLNPEFATLVRCCVDIDRSINTLGNAIQTKRWAERQGFGSLIVVTSNYHMPRALAELRHQMHGAVLVPHPVVPERPKDDDSWWTHGAPARLVVLEYLKLLHAKLRMTFNPNAGADEPE